MKNLAIRIMGLLVGSAALLPLPVLAADVGSEIVNAETHAGLAGQASDLNGVHTHLHHALNCLVGPNGNGFDAKELNPCANSGSGAIPDTTDAGKKKVLEEAAAKARDGIAATDMAMAKQDAGQVATILKTLK